TKSLINNHFTEIMNSISMAKCNFKHYISKNNFSLLELKNISEMLTQENFDLFIVFGGAKACNVAKYFSNVFCVPYMVCPSACSSVGYFSNICINPYDSTKSFVCDYAERIYICDAVIRTCPNRLVKQGVFVILSMEELLAAIAIENILFDRHIDFKEIANILERLKKEIKTIMIGDGDQKIKLMDMLIELAYNLEDIDVFKSSTFNLYCILNKILEFSNDCIGAGEVYLIASKALLLCYINLFNQKKILQLEVPNFKKLIKNIKKYAIFCKKINNFSFFKQILLSRELITRTNNLKEEFCYQCKKRLEEHQEILNIVKMYDNVFTYQSPRLNDVFTAINILPFVCENNYIVSMMGAMGYINAF
ncbi:MAG: iron-containing alcohol dehydrogenase, partial [Clostridia bacterium]|nr:iron-containing alcohol dehydrogenase [Clostridia bacterium]